MLYSQDLRKRVVSAVLGGMRKTVAARIYNVCRQTIYNWLALNEKQGNLEPETGFQKGHSHSIKDEAGFKRFVDSHPDYTQQEIALHYSTGQSSVDRMLKKLGYSRKKRVTPTQSGMKKDAGNTWKR